MSLVSTVSNSRRSYAAALLAPIVLLIIVPLQLPAQDSPQAKPKQAVELTIAEQAVMRQDALDKLKTISIALHNYHDVHKSFPPPAILSPKGNLLLSWRVAILPYLDQKDLYEDFDLTQPWDSEHNLPLVAKMPDIFKFPLSQAPAGSTVFQTARGAATAFSGPLGISYRDITDGTSKTIAVVETNDAMSVPWTKPADLPFNPADPAQGLGGHFPGVMLNSFCDGSAHVLPNTIPNGALRALLTRNGRETVSIDERGNWKVDADP